MSGSPRDRVFSRCVNAQRVYNYFADLDVEKELFKWCVSMQGVLRHRCAVQVSVREDVLVDGSEDQPVPRYQAVPPVLHWSAGHCWIWDLWCEFRRSVYSIFIYMQYTVSSAERSIYIFCFSTTLSSSSASTLPTRNCNSSSTTTCLCWSRKSIRKRALNGLSLTLVWTCRPASTWLKR